MKPSSPWGSTAIVGIGATEFSKNSGRSEMQLAVEAVTAALEDAGLDPQEVDGMSTFTMENNPENEILRLIGGRQLKFFSRTHFGGGAACAGILQAVLAIHAGICNTVVVYRALNERSGFRFGSGKLATGDPNSYETAHYGWYMPFGLMTPAAWTAMYARRYMHEYNLCSEDLGRISVAARDFAATNPTAWFYKRPITLADHQASRWIAEPLRLLDCCQESDGAVAVVLSSTDRAQQLRHPPAVVRAAAQGATSDSQMMTSYYRDTITDLPEMALIAQQMYQAADMTAEDIQLAILYDHFTFFVLPQLEAFSFCPPGEAGQFVRDGHIARGGRLPVNTHGGQIGEAYIHGLNGVAEAVRQLRGSAANQIPGVRNVLVTAGSGVPTSGLIVAAA